MKAIRMAVLAALFTGWSSLSWCTVQDPIQLRLIRTVFVGAPQLPINEIKIYAKSGSTDFFGHVLARSALIALDEKTEWNASQSIELLQRSFELLDTAQPSLFVDAGMLPGLGTDDVLFILVYALVQNGQSDQTVSILAKQADATNNFTRAVALQALRYIGSQRANDILKGKGREAKDAQLRTNLLADTYFPFFDDLYKRQSQISHDQRDRRSLLKMAQEGCGQRASLAIHLLGFMAPPVDSKQQLQDELGTLRASSGLGCYYSRYLALRALALRHDGNIDLWVERFRREQDVWIRAHIVRSAYTLFGRSFLKPALDLFATEPAQYVQWELLHGNLALRQGNAVRDEWDLWLPATLQYRLNSKTQASKMSTRDTGELLTWLEQGKRPENKIVRNILLWELASSISPVQTRRFLRALHHQPEKNSAWWILASLKDPDALPILRYWQTLPAEKNQQDELKSVILNLEALIPQGNSSRAPACCLPEKSCLISQVLQQNLTVNAAHIETPQQALVWLDGKGVRSNDVVIQFVNPLERIADVKLGAAAVQRWEHLYGCWQRIDSLPTENLKH